jgi:hypothetical protein
MAQLGERLCGRQEAAGSTPAGSTNRGRGADGNAPRQLGRAPGNGPQHGSKPWVASRPAVRFRRPPPSGRPATAPRAIHPWSSRVGRGNAADVPRDATGSQLACLASESGSIPLRGAVFKQWERPSCAGSQVLVRYTSAPSGAGSSTLPRSAVAAMVQRQDSALPTLWCGFDSRWPLSSLRVWPIGEASAFQADREGFDSPGPLRRDGNPDRVPIPSRDGARRAKPVGLHAYPLGVGQRLSRLLREQDHVGSIPTAQTNAVVLRNW